MTANLFIVWGNPTDPDHAEFDEFSFVHLKHAEDHVNTKRSRGEKRRAVILEAVESNDGERWKKAQP